MTIETKPEGKVEIPAAEVKPVIPATPAPEINWQERATQAEEKLKGVDLEKWEKVKELDPEEVQEAMKAYGIISEDEGKFKKVMEILEAKEEAKAAEAAGKPTSELDSKVAALEAKLNGFEQEKRKELSQAWMQKYETNFESAVADQKEVAGLSPLEKRAVRNYVNEKFAADSKQKKPVLGLPDVARFVAEAVKEVKDHRAFILKGAVKSDTSPDGISGNKTSGVTVEKKKPTEAADRIASMQKDFAQIQKDKAHIT